MGVKGKLWFYWPNRAEQRPPLSIRSLFFLPLLCASLWITQ
jgi:hypothetical protein